MKIELLLKIIIFALCADSLGFSQDTHVNGASSVDPQKYLSITPDLKGATLKEGFVEIAFAVKNESAEDVVISQRREGLDGLMVLDDTGQKIFLEYFESGLPLGMGGGPLPESIVLKPGQSETCYSTYPMKTLAFAADRKKKIFGAITGRIARTNQSFQWYSDPFFVPSRLTKPPWVDLGETSYFSVIPELKEGVVNGGTFVDEPVASPAYAQRIKNGWAEYLVFPVKITNTTGQSYLADTESVRFYIERRISGREGPSLWGVVKISGPLLKPGESTMSSEGNCLINIHGLESQGYKQGDRMIAAVGGRVPNTNEVFESYSAPFELPPLPKGRPPK